MLKSSLLIIYMYVYLPNVQCANILVATIVPSFSHQIVFQPIWKELSLRGHQVTVLTPNPLNDLKLVNLTEIDLGFTYETIRHSNIQISMHKDLPMGKIAAEMFNLFADLSRAELEHPSVQTFIQNKTKTFDFLLVEFLNPTFTALSSRFNCPMIGITSFGTFITGQDTVGNPTHPLIGSDIILPFMGKLGFFERLYSVYYQIWFRYYYNYYVLPEQDKLARKYVGEDIPYLGDIERSVSMLFLNVNPILHPLRPNVPALIELGKMHLQTKKQLSVDLKTELDAATEGVVYFSLGTNVISANLSTDVRDKIIQALSELPYKVFWKWEDDHLPGKPKNVIIRKWFPQQDLLGHPNIKVFLTQGGLQSMEEAIFNNVPMVGMPCFVDQPLNVMKMVDLGIAQAVDPENFTKEQLKEAIIEVAENQKYRSRIREIADLTSDVPMTGLERAIWWIEYVIRHKGARHLRSPAVDIPRYQYLLLDVLGFLLVMTLLFVFISYKLLAFSIKIAKKC